MDGVKIKRFRYLPENLELNYASVAEEISASKFGKMKIVLLTIGLITSTITECIKARPDIIHAHWAFPGGYAASVVSKIFRIKYVVSIHGGEIPLLKKFSFLQKPVIKSLNKSSQVIVNSSYSKDELEKMGVRREKIIKINPPPNFVKHCSDKEILKQFRRKFAAENTKIILFCGRLTERKGVDYLIKAFPQLKSKNVHLIIAGGGGKEEHLKKLVSSLHLENEVTFFGRANDKDLGLLHDISDVFVCPSIIDFQGETEALGLVIPEAMESQMPVIGTDVGGIPDIIKNEVNGILVPQKDPNAIANAVDKILDSTEFSTKIIQNSQETIKEFAPELIAQKHLQVFQKIIST
jgi:glycosyltransferase involved in cell wall biosynthesis